MLTKIKDRFDEKSQPRILICATLWWPASARLAMAFLRGGCRVFAVCPAGHPMRFVDGIEAVYPYRMLSPSASLESALSSAEPDTVVPCDDAAVWHLHELYERQARFRPLIERSLGAHEFYSDLRSRSRVLDTASELGIRVPATHAVNSPDEFSHAGDNRSAAKWPAVLKVDGTWGGEGVAIVRSASDASQALRSLLKANGAGRAWKRFLLNRHPLSLWLWHRARTPAITVQAFVQGRPATMLCACRNGEVQASVTVDVLASSGATGAATVIRLLKNEEMERAARLLARRFQLNGLHGLDFMIEDGTGAAHLIEVNPRATQLGHLEVLPQGSLAIVLARALGDQSPAPQAGRRTIGGETIVLFPQEWKTNPTNPLLKEAYHDVPWEQPKLVMELIRDPWPARRILNRIFQFLQPQAQAKSTMPQSESSEHAEGGNAESTAERSAGGSPVS